MEVVEEGVVEEVVEVMVEERVRMKRKKSAVEREVIGGSEGGRG